MVDEQSPVSIYRGQAHAGNLESFQLRNRGADVCMVEHHPGLVCELKVPIGLHQHSLPVTDLGFDRDEALEREVFDGVEFQGFASLRSNPSCRQGRDNTLSCALRRAEASGKRLSVFDGATEFPAQKNRESGRHASQRAQAFRAARRPLGQDQIGNSNPGVNLQLDPILPAARTSGAGNYGLYQLLLRVKPLRFQDFSPLLSCRSRGSLPASIAAFQWTATIQTSKRASRLPTTGSLTTIVESAST